MRSLSRLLHQLPVIAAAGLFIVTVAGYVRAGSPTVGDESMLNQLWQRHRAAGSEHAGMVELCAQIEARHPGYVFLPVVRCIAAWHLMRDARMDEAARMWERIDRDASRDPIGRASQRMARTWLTRMDREKVRDALREVYKENVSYPESLDVLRGIDAVRRPSLTDRWGDPWLYEWAGFRFLRMVGAGQKYRLESVNIRGPSDVSEALELDYGAGIKIRPARVITADRSGRTLEFRDEGTVGSVALTQGASYHGQLLVYAGERIVIVADADHWAVFSKPGT